MVEVYEYIAQLAKATIKFVCQFNVHELLRPCKVLSAMIGTLAR